MTMGSGITIRAEDNNPREFFHNSNENAESALPSAEQVLEAFKKAKLETWERDRLTEVQARHIIGRAFVWNAIRLHEQHLDKDGLESAMKSLQAIANGLFGSSMEKDQVAGYTIGFMGEVTVALAFHDRFPSCQIIQPSSEDDLERQTDMIIRTTLGVRTSLGTQNEIALQIKTIAPAKSDPNMNGRTLYQINGQPDIDTLWRAVGSKSGYVAGEFQARTLKFFRSSATARRAAMYVIIPTIAFDANTGSPYDSLKTKLAAELTKTFEEKR